MTDEQLITRIADTAIKHGTFTLRSGRTSHYYVDKYLFETQPDIIAALGARFAVRVAQMNGGIDRLAGPELGGVPLVTAASMATNLPCVFVRNARKEYGTAKQIEGVLELGDRVVIIEDIATSGGQSIEAANALKAAGASVEAIIVVIDRQEGARENIEQAGYRFDALFTKSDLGIIE